MIKVWNRTTTLIETIEEKDYDSKIHFHRNTHEPLNIVVKVEPTKLELLKIEATEKGITFAPNIGYDKLKEKLITN